MNPSLSTAFLVVASLFARCGGDQEVAVAPLAEAADSRSVSTSNYLLDAVLPGTFFRWTPSVGSTVIDVPIEIHNAAGELPPRFLLDGFDAEEIERQVREVVALWATEASKAGLEVRPELAFHARGQGFGGDPRTRIHLRFASPLGGAFQGQAGLLVDSESPQRVLAVELEIQVPILVEPIPLAGYRALLAHEFGHAFGVISDAPASGHSLDGNDVMFPVAQWSSLSDGDRATILELYALQPDLRRDDSGTAQANAPHSDDLHFLLNQPLRGTIMQREVRICQQGNP